MGGFADGCLNIVVGGLTFELPRFSIKMGIRADISGISSVGYFTISGIISYKIAFARIRMSTSVSETVRQVFKAWNSGDRCCCYSDLQTKF